MASLLLSSIIIFLSTVSALESAALDAFPTNDHTPISTPITGEPVVPVRAFPDSTPPISTPIHTNAFLPAGNPTPVPVPLHAAGNPIHVHASIPVPLPFHAAGNPIVVHAAGNPVPVPLHAAAGNPIGVHAAGNLVPVPFHAAGNPIEVPLHAAAGNPIGVHAAGNPVPVPFHALSEENPLSKRRVVPTNEPPPATPAHATFLSRKIKF